MFEQYRKVLRLAGIRTPPHILFLTGGAVLFVSIFLSAIFHNLLPLLFGLVVADLIIFYPYSKGQRIIASIEENLPDALKQIATTLKSGGTFEMAVREVVASDYGPLSHQFRYVLEDLQSGNTLDIALTRLAERVPSELVSRISTIIIDAFHAGGGLAQVLEDVAEDARETQRLFAERRAKTTMQVMFLVAASALISPFIVGSAFGIMDFFKEMGMEFARSGILKAAEYKKSVDSINLLQSLLTFYVLFQAFLSAMMIGIVREGKPSEGVRIAPWLLLIAYVILTLSRMGIGGLLSR